MVYQPDLLLARLSKHAEGLLRFSARDLLQQPAGVIARDWQTGDLGNVLSLRTRGVLVRRQARSRWVTRIQREELHATTLDGSRVARGTLRIGGIAVRDCDCA